MKSTLQIVFASLLVVLMASVTASAYALSPMGGHHVRSQTYHDRTPKAHTHGSHPHRS
jgi:hypothetical protein